MSTSIHRFTSAHRQAGGLRRVAFVLRAVARRQQVSSRPLNIALIGWAQGSIALPLLDAGYHVALIENDISIRRDAEQVAEECGLEGFSTTAEFSLERNEAVFDICIIDLSRRDLIQTALAVVRPHLEAHGRILVSGACSEGIAGWASFQSMLFSAGWRMRDAASTVALPSSLLRRPSKSGIVARTIETLMVHLLPFRRAAAWMGEAVPCDPERAYALHLMPSLGVGGAEKLVLDLTTGLRPKGFETGVISIISGGDLAPAFQERGIEARSLHRRDPFGVSTVIDLVRIFRLERPAIVHTHLFGADAWGRLAAFIARVPVVISTEHNINPSYSWIKRLVNRIFAKWTSAIVAVSDAVKGVSATRDRIPEAKLRVIPNAIDLSRVVSRGGHMFRDIPRLFIAARLYPQKDHATLLKALALIKRPWLLRIAGDGPLKHDLVRLAERLDISSRIEWLGVRHDVPQLLADSDVFCFPSRWEGLGNAVLEAAAAGVPVICSDLPPLHEVFQDNDVTFVESGNVPAWAHAIQDILDDPSDAIIRATRLVPRVHAGASLDRMVDAYAALYHDCLSHL
ncbi:MAG: glycosyltransferase [Patescibacteria group bacterium]